jgi:glycosyltransferase involved in cell wall biosynthesis
MLRKEKPDAVVFVWWIWVWALPYLTMMALLPKKTSVILQCHNVGEKEPTWWKAWLSKRVLRRGDALVVHALTEIEEARRRAPGKFMVSTQLPVHELGGDIPPREKARSRLGLTARNVALFFGHVRPFKGLDIALRAWTKLQTNVTLVVAGEAWWDSEQEYRQLARDLTNVRFDFRYIPDAEIAAYFSAADVVLAPYRTEAQSGVILTAFHFERPVIATRVGGIPEIVVDDENGLLIPPEDPEALARAIDRFFTVSDRGALERGAAASAAKFSWEDYGKLFTSLVQGR